MLVTAKLRYLRIAPRKVRLVADLIRGKKVEEAQTILNFATKKASLPLSKLLKQGIANAKNNFQIELTNLFISKIIVDEGPKYKRWQARARGQAYEIQKKTSHITIILDEIVKKPKKVKRVRKPKAIEKPEERIEEAPKIEKPKFRPEKELIKPKREGVLKRVFRRKAF